MSLHFERPGLIEIQAEQQLVQADKFQGRMLKEYNSRAFPGQGYRRPVSSAASDIVRPLCDDERVTLEGVIEGLYENQGENRPVSWVDMGGGRALPMRQALSLPQLEGKFTATSVDLFDYGLKGLASEELEFLETTQPGMTDDQNRPEVVIGNIEEISLSKPADLITSVEAVQYLNDPVAALANWYNQLNDGGVMVVATQHDWASWVRYAKEPECQKLRDTPTEHLVHELGKTGIDFAAVDEPDMEWGRPKLNPNRFSTLIVRKRAGTSMTVHAEVEEVWVNPHQYKSVYYETPAITGKPVATFVRDRSS